VAVAVVVVTLGVVAILFARSGAGRRLLEDSSTPTKAPVKAQAMPRPTVSAFDPPPGDGREHDSELDFLVDGDPATTWTTEQYASSHLTQLKPGVGVVFRLDGAHKLGQMRITSATKGWGVEILVADALKTTRAAWGTPAATKEIAGGETTIDLGGRSGSAVLLWITDLGDNNSAVSIGEVTLTSA